MISSLANATVKSTYKLRKARERERRGALLVEGHRAVRAAIAAGARVSLFLHTPRARERTDLLDAAARVAGKVSEVAEPVMAHLTAHAHPPDCLAVVVAAPSTLEQALASDLVVVLCDVHDPAVVGGVLAAAAAAGAGGAVTLRATADPFAPACIRAGNGAHFVLALCAGADATDVAAGLGERAALLLSGEGLPVCSEDMRRPAALLVADTDPPAVFASARRVPMRSGPHGVGPGQVARAAIVLGAMGAAS